MKQRCHLIRIGGGPVSEPAPWPHGELAETTAEPEAIQRAVDGLEVDEIDLLLFWSQGLGAPPDPFAVAVKKGEVWHAGLRLGQSGRPGLLSFIHPTWMLQRDPSPDVEASSWRLSLRACLAPVAIWRAYGGVRTDFQDLDTASLELGFRWWRCGALMRHVPEMVADDADLRPAEDLPLDDELRFLRAGAGRFWTTWATVRASMTGERPRLSIWRAWNRARRVSRAPLPPEINQDSVSPDIPEEPPKIAVLIPTLDRYPYLEVVLDQLQAQTLKPHEVVVIDQTAPDRRDRAWHGRFPDLPLRVLERDRPGQSSARNAGLQTLSSDFVLFLDDDVEIEPDLVERHWRALDSAKADASCGVTTELGAGPLPEEFRRRRLSDVFPTCNCMARTSALKNSGLFDLAFDHGSRADADLGTRVYLSGGLMVLEPSISVFHHKAPAGGLRQHGARVVTYADSRRRLWARHLPNATELYLARRYFTPLQAKEALLIRLLGTLKGSGGAGRKLLKLIVGLAQLPSTYGKFRQAEKRAEQLLESYPQIPELQREPPR